ncbi:RNA polymerase II CTD heptapeptide repeat phosphatase [Aureococcus anophagefferens]|uniref:RNA polymerase II CTD heptapeptide repeat phosphatase n=1 Tax=Aureococcus anophagefferens TaxID=44056 RepID=A0ABR1G7E2_AURAN
MGFVICVGETIHERMLKKPMMTILLSVQAGLLLSFGVLMSCQVGGRWGSSTGVNNFVFAGFGIPFGLTFIVMCQGAELITANYMFCSFAIKGLLGNWFFCWWSNLLGAVLHFVMFAWSTGLIKSVRIDGELYSDPTDSLEHDQVLWYKSNQDFRDDMNGDLCSRSNYGMANLCKVVKVCRAKCTAHFTTSIIRGAGCNWMVCLAIWLQMIATEPISKFIMIWLPIELFISSGFDHLVVNEFLIPAGIMVGGKYYDDRCNWGNAAFWFNFVPVTLGSIVGAWFLVFPFWLINKDGWMAAQTNGAAAPATAIVDGKPETDPAPSRSRRRPRRLRAALAAPAAQRAQRRATTTPQIHRPSTVSRPRPGRPRP